MNMHDKMKRYGFTDQHGHDLMKCQEFQQLLALWNEAEAICEESPPDDWEPEDMYGDPRGYPGVIDDPDTGNSLEMQEFGELSGKWMTARRLRAAMK